MKPNTLRCLGVAAAAAAGVWCWYLLMMEAESAAGTAEKGLARAAQVTGNQFASSPAEPLPKFGTDEFRHALHERGLKWLESRGRDAEGLITVWDLTNDLALLDEAAEKFPNHPLVCMGMIERNIRRGKREMLWIDRLIAAEPANPEGHYQKVWALMDGDWVVTDGTAKFVPREDRVGALTALRQAAETSGSRDNHLRSRIQTVHEASLAIGVSPGDAARLALAGPVYLHATHEALESVNKVIQGEMVEAKAAGNEDRVTELIGLGLTTAEKFSGAYPETIIGELHISRMKLEILEELAHDTEIADGRTLVSLKAEINARRNLVYQSMKHAERVNALRDAASDDVMVTFFNCFMDHGEQAATVWLLQQGEKAK